MPPITNLAFFSARHGRSEELGAALSNLIDPTRAEPGCLDYYLHRSLDDPDRWLVYENWTSAEDMQAHMGTPHVKAFLTAAPDLVAGDIEQRRYTKVSTPPSRV